MRTALHAPFLTAIGVASIVVAMAGEGPPDGAVARAADRMLSLSR